MTEASNTGKQRALSLDAFRGYAILTMILSGSIVWGVLPAWMYHAQEGPRSGFHFDPTIYGITWVDLVFPFFLFAMGAAFPFSIGSKITHGKPKRQIVSDIILRYFRLLVFAIAVQHLYPYFISAPQDLRSWVIALSGFALLFPMYMRLPGHWSRLVRMAVRLIGYGLMAFMVLSVNYANHQGFSLSDSNIILLLLANMALFGSLIYVCTVDNGWLRVAVLPMLAGMLLAARNTNSWNRIVFEFTPVSWAFRFDYLKYLFIVIPGSFAGEYLKDWCIKATSKSPDRKENNYLVTIGLTLIPVLIIIVNLYGLYTRALLLNLGCTFALLAFMHILISRSSGISRELWRKMYRAGAYLLVLGLVFEAFEGGVRKDTATFSYYFITSGLAFLSFITFHLLCDVFQIKWLTHSLGYAGQNPMIAYVAIDLLSMPVLNLTGAASYLEVFSRSALLGFTQGVVLTTLAFLVTYVLTKRGCYWRT